MAITPTTSSSLILFRCELTVRRRLAALVLVPLGLACSRTPTCDAKQLAGCAKQCARGTGAACARLANAERRDVAERAKWDEKACNNGVAPSCTRLGEAAEFGRGAVPIARAQAAYKRGCDAGDQLGCAYLAGLFETGADGSTPDLGKAARLYGAACRAGEPTSCASLGRMTELGRGTKRDPKAAAKLFDQACKGGEPSGCERLARLHRRSVAGFSSDPKRANALEARGRALRTRGCAEGVSIDCIALGRYERACQLGDPDGCDRKSSPSRRR